MRLKANLLRWSFSRARQVLSAGLGVPQNPCQVLTGTEGLGLFLPSASPWKGCLLSSPTWPGGSSHWRYMLIWLALHVPLQEPVKTLRAQSKEMLSPNCSCPLANSSASPLGPLDTVEELKTGPCCQGLLRLIREVGRDINVTRPS